MTWCRSCRADPCRFAHPPASDVPPDPAAFTDEVRVDAGPAHTELAARMPWTVAEPESWWRVTGTDGPRHTFTDCVARVLPESVTGGGPPLFEVLVYGDPLLVPASAVTGATRLLLVEAAEWDALVNPICDERDALRRQVAALWCRWQHPEHTVTCEAAHRAALSAGDSPQPPAPDPGPAGSD